MFLDMSYTEKIREHFIEELPKSRDKREKLLLGLLVNAKTDGEVLEASFSSEYAFCAAKDLMRLLRNLTPEVSTRTVGRRTDFIISMDNAKFVSFVSEQEAHLADALSAVEDVMYYSRGVFLASGRISSPDAEESHLEFSFSRRESAERFRDILASFDYPSGGISKRREKSIVYFKSRDKLCDILTAMDSGSFVFEYLNRSIYKSIEWNERRAINFISGNINRAVIAGEKQTREAEFMLEYHDGAHLSPELYATAVLRVNNPALPLSELAALHTPELTKSGLNHRLAKISELAKKYGFRL